MYQEEEGGDGIDDGATDAALQGCMIGGHACFSAVSLQKGSFMRALDTPGRIAGLVGGLGHPMESGRIRQVHWVPLALVLSALWKVTWF